MTTGSPYAVAPGRVRKPDGTPLRGLHALTSAAGREHGWRGAGRVRAAASTGSTRRDVDGREPARSGRARSAGPRRHAAARARRGGGAAALARVPRPAAVNGYDDDRDRPDHAGTSRMSPYLKWGCMHPRTLLADLAKHRSAGAAVLPAGAGLAGVLRRPGLPPAAIDLDVGRPGDRPHALGRRAGRPTSGSPPGRPGSTGYPYIDAGMRQLLAEGWMHNRVRMGVASFLIKDLHLPWQRGAAHFLEHLVDGDYASNNHGWQWVAGVRTAGLAVLPGLQPDHPGREVRPRTATTSGGTFPNCAASPARPVHRPWELADDAPAGYPRADRRPRRRAGRDVAALGVSPRDA